jgi:hypothetical protein
MVSLLDRLRSDKHQLTGAGPKQGEGAVLKRAVSFFDLLQMQGRCRFLVASRTNACCMVDSFGSRWNVTRRILDCWRKA